MSFADDWDHWARSFPARVARGWRDFLDAIATLAAAGGSPDYDDISTNDANTDVTGAELEELTDGSETTLHSHADEIAETIPHFSKGTGPFTVHCVGGYVYCGDAGASEVARIHPRDMILVMNGGASSPSYTFDIKKLGGAYAGSDSDPTVPYIEVDADDATLAIVVYASDGTTVRETDIFVVCQGTLSP